METKFWCFLFLYSFKSVSAKGSLSIVVDTTASMYEEITTLKKNLFPLIQNIKDSSSIDNYVLVTFNDPEVILRTKTSDVEEYMSHVNSLTSSGGQDCPENSLAAIQKALELSDTGSYIYLFTDASPKQNNYSAIENLCKNKNSQVFLFLSGSCSNKDSNNNYVYNEITAACSGLTLRLYPHHLKQVFNFMEESMLNQWSSIEIRKTFYGEKQILIPVTQFTTKLLVAISGEYPIMDITIDRNPVKGMKNIVSSRHSKVIELLRPMIGEYLLKVRGRKSANVVIYSLKQFPFKYGFSTLKPRNLRETAKKPIPGWLNYILISVPDFPIVKLNMVTFFDNYNGTEQSSPIEEIAPKLYMTKANFAPFSNYRMTVTGTNLETLHDFKETAPVIIPQDNNAIPSWVETKVEILDGDQQVEYGSNVILACIVEGYPRPEIWWKDNDILLSTETAVLETPSTFISYLSLPNIKTKNTYFCEARSSTKNITKSVTVSVHRSYGLNIIDKPEDVAAEYGVEEKIFCSVNAYPEATIQWYHNDTAVTNFHDITIEDGALVINRMDIDHVGTYTCVITNDFDQKNMSAVVTISGLEEPKILQTGDSYVVIRSEEQSMLECRVSKGNPSPKITWKFKPDETFEFNDVPYDIVNVGDGKIQFTDPKPEQRGVYRCEANNILGADYRDFNVDVLFKPIIQNDGEQTVTRKEGSVVELVCNVNANPKASVQWTKTVKDKEEKLEQRHSIDDKKTLRFIATARDTGEYHCTAENELGTEVKSVSLEVLVPVYIEPPKQKVIIKRRGETVTLPCNVLYGHPQAIIFWQHVNNGRTTVFKSGPSPNNLVLNNLRSENDGIYYCIAKNDVGTDSIKLHLKVTN